MHLFVAEEFEVDPQSLRSIINSESLTPVRVTAPVRSTLGGPIMRKVITCLLHKYRIFWTIGRSGL
jgi:hypothetical protein